jgi:hypothetical protein
MFIICIYCNKCKIYQYNFYLTVADAIFDVVSTHNQRPPTSTKGTGQWVAVISNSSTFFAKWTRRGCSEYTALTI